MLRNRNDLLFREPDTLHRLIWFFPVGGDIRQIVVDWVNYLRQEKLWGLDDPLFPATKVVVSDTQQHT